MANDDTLSLKEILDALNNLNPGISFKFYTAYHEWIVDTRSYNTAYCSMVHNNRKLSVGCAQSDYQSLKTALSTGNPLSYRCHMGALEYVYPVFKNGNPLGVFFLGQFLHKPPEPSDYQNLAQICKESDLDYNAFRVAYDQLQIMEESKLKDFLAIFKLCGFYLVNHDSNIIHEMPVVKKIDEYLNKHLSEPLTLESLAHLVNLSPAYLSTLYKKRTKITLSKHIQKKRIDCACYLLRTTEKTISEITHVVGLSDQNYLARIFKEQMHVTPRYYREHWEEIEKGQNLQEYIMLER